MDTLSQLLHTARLRAPLFADLRLGANVSVGLPSLGCLPLHYVAKGACRIRMGAESDDLVEGDVAIPVRATQYRLETGSGVRRFEVMDHAERDDFTIEQLKTGVDRLLTSKMGGKGLSARVLSTLLVPADRNGGLFRNLPDLILIHDVKSLLEPWLVDAIDVMAMNGRDHEPGQSAIAERLAEVVFIAALRRWLLDRGQQPGWMRGLGDPAISRVVNAIHADPGRRWSLHELATASGRSRSGFSRHFREVMNETPFAYLLRWRMHIATEAVAKSNRSIAEIADSLGYREARAFIRAFVTALGESPAQYRRRMRSG
ncbi:cupin domain-containing protein [Lichenicoccus sp.]|uniref:AraC family transcriptional regulator n=1 Tax=Lichenicoccus sp. TaxID=2781899 RepID=UPI003D0B5377